jgi:probable HAF family extracellular repeat protein
VHAPHTKYAQDVAKLITLDTPHSGASLASHVNNAFIHAIGASLGESFACQNADTLNRRELVTTSFVIQALNNNLATISSDVNVAAIKSYTTSGLLGASDGVVSDHEQSIRDLASKPTFSDVENFVGPFTVSNCVPLHPLGCVGIQPSTSPAVYSQAGVAVGGQTTSLTIQATLDGVPWSGSVNYVLSGPQGLSGTWVPRTFYDVPTGTYALSFLSGGVGANIDQASTQRFIGSDNTDGSNTWNGAISISFRSVPSVTTGVATGVTVVGATLTGITAKTRGVSANGWFEWGTTSNLITYNQTSIQSLAPDAGLINLTASLNGLISNTSYYYRLVAATPSGNPARGAILTFSTNANPGTTGTITDLGSLGGSAYASGLNAAGQVVGEFTLTNFTGESHGFLYSAGILTDLGSFGRFYNEPSGINAAGQIVGTWTTNVGTSHTFLYSNGVTTTVGKLGDSVRGINSSGQIAGYSGSHAALFSGGSTTDLGTLGGSSSFAKAINDAGQIAGTSFTAHARFHAFLYSGGTMVDLGTLGRSSIDSSDGWAINAAGQVVGDSTSAVNTHAFWYAAGSMIDLGTLGNPAFPSTAFGINNAGQIVGYSGTPTGNSAFLFSQGTMMDLNSILPAKSALHLEIARAINDAGQIAGNSVVNGVSHAWLVTMPAVLPTCDINADQVTNVADVQLIVNEALGVALSVHDLNRDGVVNVADIQKVINAALGLICILP